MADEQEFWFAARTRANQELSLRNSLRKIEITHYLPTHVVTRRISDRVKRVEVPVINNLIFIKATKQVAFSLIKDHGLKISYIRNSENNSMLVVPEKQMADFMFVMDLDPESIKQCTADFVPGEKVRVIKGSLTGVEGEMVRIEGKTHVLLRVPQILAISVKVPKAYLEKMK
ncbi:UpxY family transcription antiterminator [Bacteroides sp. 519]|uniref:UpxY family transcription antiterminator n=1 Tax=Bacteroides sp. 519 TaxID=2302937 RepID=UPI0013CFC214|nr:UpxY family transcription antiterminator [Bacteroides sp. 519]NDV60286.1 UpxY family transcription antiterminator [Bacteroides sp. 519]